MHTGASRKVIVTGACGNLGRKVIEALACTDWCEHIVGIDRSIDAALFSAAAQTRLHLIRADLSERTADWTTALQGGDAVIHFATGNPLPDSTWLEAIASYQMTLNVVLASALAGIERFVFASSNHAMGAYKDLPLAAQIGPGQLTSTLPAAPGTRWHDGNREIHSLAYGTSKVMGEQLCSTIAELSKGKLSTLSIRVGWVLTGANDPRDITHAGSPASVADIASLSDDDRRALQWFQNMWLSNRDLTQLFLLAVSASSEHWPSPAIIVNGMSHNQGMAWDLSGAREYLGYAPKDDVQLYLNKRSAP